MKRNLSILLVAFGMFFQNAVFANQPVKDFKALVLKSEQNNKQMKNEALLTSRKWICMEVSKKKLTKKLDFEVGNICNLSIDKKYAFKNNNYDYSNGTWKLDGKILYFFYNAKDGSNRIETAKFKILTLNSTTLILKRLEKPKGKLTFK